MTLYTDNIYPLTQKIISNIKCRLYAWNTTY